jgi:hypothetical protein
MWLQFTSKYPTVYVGRPQIHPSIYSNDDIPELCSLFGSHPNDRSSSSNPQLCDSKLLKKYPPLKLHNKEVVTAPLRWTATHFHFEYDFLPSEIGICLVENWDLFGRCSVVSSSSRLQGSVHGWIVVPIRSSVGIG